MEFFSIDNNQVVIRPLRFLKFVGIALLLLFILLPVVMMLIAFKGDFGQLEPGSFAAFLIMAPLMLACLPLFNYSRRQVIFDGNSRTIVRKTIFGKKILMGFDQVAGIVLQSMPSLAYYLKNKEDRYGKGILVSPFFFWKKR